MVDNFALPEGESVTGNTFALPEGETVGGNTVQQPIEQQGGGLDLRGGTSTAAQGATFGLSDEITAALAAIPAAIATGTSLKDAFNSILDAERSELEQFSEENPKTAFGLTLAGGLATGGVGASKVAGAKIFQGGKTVLGRTGKKLAASSAAAAPIGALFGAGVSEGGLDAEGLKQRGEGALEGAVIGAVASPLLAAGAGAASRTVRGVVNLFKGKEAKTFTQSTKQLAQAIARDDDTPEALLQRAKDLGPEATLADVGRTNIKRELERAASNPGRAPEMVEKALVGRLARSGIRVQQVFDKFIGKSNKTAVQTIDDIGTEATEKAAPFYTKAYEAKIDNADPRLASLLANPRIQKAIPRAIDRIKSKSSDDKELLRQMQSELNPENPNMILWDHVKRQLDDDASAAFRRGENSLGGDIAKNAKMMRDALDIQSPAYKEARSIWAGSSRAEEAYTDGLNFLKGLNNPLTGASEKAAKFADLSTSEKDLFKKGVSMAVRQVIRSADDSVDGTPPASLIKKIFGSKEKRFILNKVIPTAKGRQELVKSLKAENEFRKTTNDILRNSRTALRVQLNKEPSAQLEEKAGQAVNAWFALSGNFFAMTRGISGAFKSKPASEAVNTQVAKRLLVRGEQSIDGALKDVEKFLNVPEAATSAIARYKTIPKGEKIAFLRANPQIKKELDRTIAALTAGIYASGRVRETNNQEAQ